uniref:Ribosome-recycling factor, mitochondrial n=1 Tax=Sinocyclocheilus rhinocerous TaxID=307959 RepID=A0A673NA60_9TELE
MALSHLNLLRPVLCRFLPSVVRSPLLTSSRVPSLPHTSCPALLPNYVRHYATKKSKAKGQTAKVNINAALVEDIISLEEVKEDMAAVLATLKEDFSRNLSIRTSPGQDLDHILIYTQLLYIPCASHSITRHKIQCCLVSLISTLVCHAMAAVTRALQDSSMGLNPEVEGTIIRVPVPRVTREHRENLVKLAKQFSNKAKDSLRKVRTNAVTRVKKSKEGVSEDTIHLIEKQVTQMN